MRRSTTALVLAGLAAGTACSSGSSPMDPPGSGDTFTATVDGQPWTGRILAPPTRYDGFAFSLLGIDQGVEIGLTINTTDPEATLPGTLDLRAGFTGGHVSEGTETWFPGGQGGSGTITIIELTPDRARGTFSFLAVPLGASATGTRSVTNGSFDVTF